MGNAFVFPIVPHFEWKEFRLTISSVKRGARQGSPLPRRGASALQGVMFMCEVLWGSEPIQFWELLTPVQYGVILWGDIMG